MDCLFVCLFLHMIVLSDVVEWLVRALVNTY